MCLTLESRAEKLLRSALRFRPKKNRILIRFVLLVFKSGDTTLGEVPALRGGLLEVIVPLIAGISCHKSEMVD